MKKKLEDSLRKVLESTDHLIDTAIPQLRLLNTPDYNPIATVGKLQDNTAKFSIKDVHLLMYCIVCRCKLIRDQFPVDKHNLMALLIQSEKISDLRTLMASCRGIEIDYEDISDYQKFMKDDLKEMETCIYILTKVPKLSKSNAIKSNAKIALFSLPVDNLMIQQIVSLYDQNKSVKNWINKTLINYIRELVDIGKKAEILLKLLPKLPEDEVFTSAKEELQFRRKPYKQISEILNVINGLKFPFAAKIEQH